MCVVLVNDLIHTGAGELGELPRGGEDDERDVGIAENGELLGLLEEAAAALGERDLPRRRALYPLYLPPLPRHRPRRSLSAADADTPRPPRAEHRRTTSREAEAEEAGAAASQPAVGAVM